MINTIKTSIHFNEFFDKRLPEFTELEGFICLIMLRRKWLINQFPEKEEIFRKLFSSNEICLRKIILSGNREKFKEKIINNLSIFSPDFSITKIYKNKKFSTYYDFYKNYKNAISLLITFEPRDLNKAIKIFITDYVRKLVNNNITEREIQHIDLEWYKYVHKSKRKSGDKFVLIDIDYDILKEKDYFNKYKEYNYNRYLLFFINDLKEYFKEINILCNLRYVCTTPSKGLHCIFKIDENVEKNIFARQQIFKNDILYIADNYASFPVKEVEIKTGQVLTHIPTGLNDYIKDLTNDFLDKKY